MPSLLAQGKTLTMQKVSDKSKHMNSNRVVRKYVIIVVITAMQVTLVSVEPRGSLVLAVENKIILLLCRSSRGRNTSSKPPAKKGEFNIRSVTDKAEKSESSDEDSYICNQCAPTSRKERYRNGIKG